jgi:hypothetical protein
MDTLIWVIAYSSKNDETLSGFLKDPEYFFASQEEAHSQKQEAFKILYMKGAVTTVDQLTVVPINELGVKIEE